MFDARDTLAQTRIDFLLTEPFFGQIGLRLNLVEREDIPTMAVDGRNLFYNAQFVKSLCVENTDPLKFVLAHEILHCCYSHMLRRDGRNAARWNRAADYVINQELTDLKIGRMPTMLNAPDWSANKEEYKKSGAKETDVYGLLNSRFRGMTSDQVYEILEKEDEENSIKVNIAGVPGEGGNWDIHIDAEGMGADEKDQMAAEIRQAVIEAAQTAQEHAKLAGTERIPPRLRDLIKQWTKSQVCWKTYLHNVVVSQLKSDYTWSRTNRKSQSQGIYLPGLLNDERVEVHVAIDTSGSITAQDIQAFLSEVNGIMEQFQDYELTVWCFDTCTYRMWKFTPDGADRIEDFEPEGGGGTLFECNWDMMKSEGILPSQFVMFTDGMPAAGWGDPNYADTVFVIKDNPNAQAPFGVTVHYTDPQ